MEQLQQLKTFENISLVSLAQVQDEKELEEWRVAVLGKKSLLTSVMKSLAELTPEQKKTVGEAANNTKDVLNEAFSQAAVNFTATTAENTGLLDITLPGRTPDLGRKHIISAIIDECCDIFCDMGFTIAEGNEVETPYYNFDALNMPPNHSARDTMDTFWLEDKDKNGRTRLLRTHTSPMQVRFMEKNQPPIRIIVPGKVYRYEATDATHLSMFHQIEGLAVGENITMADLKGVLITFLKRLFGEDRKTRFRVDYFPFVEPGAEIAIDCAACGGQGCSICKGTGWVEVLGAGMVHPQVLTNGGVDNKKYSGFAFGVGIERIAMLRYGIEDIRNFYNNDLRFLGQF
ncbi:MAG: phenylalanine--tRNA ligase subunit alpha [Chloroflexi bacterium]|nr:phenylalanine--tRNA ligase subunit alpha [Chloroflexota bacterium]